MCGNLDTGVGADKTDTVARRSGAYGHMGIFAGM